mmetsp:Transcript_10650/g.20371  ORF Transcript_10650/g.20371 Transcript_10650/m.20371 type:complete len:81 (-) Transcript_10650:62-304(-)
MRSGGCERWALGVAGCTQSGERSELSEVKASVGWYPYNRKALSNLFLERDVDNTSNGRRKREARNLTAMRANVEIQKGRV